MRIPMKDEDAKKLAERPSVSRDEVMELMSPDRSGGRWGNVKKGRRDDLPWPTDSGWEANVGRVLLYMQERGWIFEVERLLPSSDALWFEFPVEHGTTRTLLDYRFNVLTESVIKPVKKDYWVEVKGEMDTHSKTRIKRFKKYYPDEFARTIFVVQHDSKAEGILGKRRKKTTAHSWLYSIGARLFWFYGDLKKQFSSLVNWE